MLKTSSLHALLFPQSLDPAVDMTRCYTGGKYVYAVQRNSCLFLKYSHKSKSTCYVSIVINIASACTSPSLNVDATDAGF